MVLKSVVFASSYRFSVLFTYTNDDPTYSLAPTVGWTAIEMSAGIVSACLPTMGPVVGVCARALGIKRTFFSSRKRSNGASTGMSGKHKTPASSFAANRSATATATATITGPGADPLSEMELQRTGATRKDGAGAFYRLPDVHISGEEDELDELDELDEIKQGGHGAATPVTTAVAAPPDAGLRPDRGNYAYEYAVTTTRPGTEGKSRNKISKTRTAELDNSSSDEVPLHGIRVQTDFRRSD